MNIRLNRAAALCCLGLFGVSGLPVPSPAGDQGSILSTLIQPLQIRSAAAQDAGEAVTSSHVYQITSDLISEIEILRHGMSVTDYAYEAEPADDRAPIHTYAKSLEVLEKISAAQKRLGMKPAKIGQIPVKTITDRDVYKSVQVNIKEVRRMKEQLHIEDAIRPAPLEGGVTPSLVYEHLGDASYLMDGLVGHPVDPSDVYVHMVFVHDEMELIAAKLKVALELDPPAVTEKKRMREVGQQVQRATFKLVNLQTRLGMDASGIPQLTLVRVDPALVYEATNIMLAELVRIKAHLGIQLPREEHAISRNKNPQDVFGQVLLLIKNLDILAKAADNYQSS